jgi:hypothetical protein
VLSELGRNSIANLFINAVENFIVYFTGTAQVSPVEQYAVLIIVLWLLIKGEDEIFFGREW